MSPASGANMISLSPAIALLQMSVTQTPTRYYFLLGPGVSLVV
uniref:Uncharacterized protein n=1 Tax=Anguilla anguilla TaxID=7936 RepID=A0A0E9SNK0_ANGAN